MGAFQYFHGGLPEITHKHLNKAFQKTSRRKRSAMDEVIAIQDTYETWIGSLPETFWYVSRSTTALKEVPSSINSDILLRNMKKATLVEHKAKLNSKDGGTLDIGKLVYMKPCFEKLVKTLKQNGPHTFSCLLIELLQQRRTDPAAARNFMHIFPASV